MSFLQQTVDAVDSGNANVFYKNPVKFGLSFLSIGFDILFMIQHYCLYTNREDRAVNERLVADDETEIEAH